MLFMLVLQKLCENVFCKNILHKIWSLISTFELLIFVIKNKNFIYHVGLFGRNINVGDCILYKRLEETFDEISKNKWFHRLAFGKITSLELYLINKYCKAIIVGGHGLIMPESNENNNSGWGFNITINNLKKIKKPMVFFAIGYNTFKDDDNFIPIFNEHIKLCVEKSIFFGLRNYGSIRALEKYLPENLHNKLKYQPCPTTITEIRTHETVCEPDDNKEIGISVAFNKFKKRFGNNYKMVFEQLIKYCHYMENMGYKIIFLGHHILDVNSKYSKYFKNLGYPILPLYKYSEDNIYKIYKNKKLIIGMRGHGLMIPFGLTVPIISLETQEKQKWFIETTNHSEWNIKITDKIFDTLLERTIEIIEKYDFIIDEIKKIQNRNKKTTFENIGYIIKEIKEVKNGT